MTKIKTELKPVPVGGVIMLDGKEWHEQEPLKLRPKDGDAYTVLMLNGACRATPYSDSFDTKAWNQGNGFLLQADANREGERRALEKQLLDCIKTLNHREGWKPDFDDREQVKAFFNCYSPSMKEFYIDEAVFTQMRSDIHYFKPELEAEIRKQFSHQNLRFIYNGVRDE